MLLVRDSEKSKSKLDCLRGVSSLRGKSFERRLMGKWKRLLGIRWGFGGRFGGFLYVQGGLLTDDLCLLLTDGGLWIGNV